MKFLQICLFVLATGFIFSSCTKDMSYETGTALGVLKDDGSGDCLPITIHGTYTVGTVLTSTSSVDVQVDFNQEGVYSIKSDTVNGYSFAGTGSVSSTGISTIHLVASGTPAAIGSGVDVFHITYGASVCSFNVVLGGGTPAMFTLGVTGTACTGAALAGTYMAGLATSGTNTVTVNVIVTQAGSYSINTGTTVNGVSFSGSGTFASTGSQTITLVANGTPTAAGAFNYPLTAGATTCNFSVTYAAAAPPADYTIDCTGATVAGTYQIGTAMNSGNTVTIHATSTGAGFYSVTATANGVTFSSSGTFPGAVTNQAIILTASGTPTGSAGTVSFPAVATTSTVNSTCSFNVTYTAASFITASINGGPVTTFNVTPTATHDNTTIPPYSYIVINGFHDTGTTSEEIFFGAGTSTGYPVSPSTFTVNDNTTHDVQADYTLPSGADDAQSQSNFPTVQTNPFTVNFTTISSTVAIGTFSGRLYLNNGAGPTFVDITAGSFNVTF